MLLVGLAFLLILVNDSFSNDGLRLTQRPLPLRIYGITIDSIENLSDILDSISGLSKMPMSRIVFDEWQPAKNYLVAVEKISEKSYVMGELLDSFSFSHYNLKQFRARANEYFLALKGKVDLWEIGNEINGEWLGGTSSVVAKMTAAFDMFEARGERTALTLYYNPNCWAKASHEMFRWAKANIPNRMKRGLDYVFVSYYEEDCNNYQPDWKSVMLQVSQIFPNSKVGVGECGTRQELQKEALLTQYYTMNLELPSFVGGYFWWYFNQDMVPKTKRLWSTLNSILSSLPQ